MPKRKGTHRGGFYERSRSRRKKARRRPKRLPRRSRIRRPIRMFPKTALVELSYCDKVEVPTRTGSAHPYIFKLNSLFDPDHTSTGHQPRGFDQWKTMYNKYCVIGATVLIEPLKASAYESFTLFSYVDDDTTTELYTVEDLRELRMPSSKTKYVTVQNDADVPVTGWRRIKHNVGMKKFFGLAKKTQMFHPSGVGQGDDDDDTFYQENYAADTDRDPLRKCYLKLSAEGVDGGAFNVKCRVTIKYMAVMYDPKEISSS